MIEVGAYRTRTDAELAQSALAAAGIESELAADDAGGAYPFDLTGSVRLLVDEADADDARTVLSGAAPSFETDVKPLFRESDRSAMLSHFDLWSHDDVKANADAILGAVRAGTMPCDGAWPADKVDLLQRWIESGAPA